MFPSLILDLVFVLVLVLSCALGVKKGFVLSFCGLVAFFVALFGALFVSNALCEPVAQAITPYVEKLLQQGLDQTLTQRGLSMDQLSLGELSDALKNVPFLQSLPNALGGVNQAAGSLFQSVSSALARELARMVLFVLSFLLILLLWFFLSHALDLVAKLPVLSTANRLGGGLVGLVKGFLLLVVCAWVLTHTSGLLDPKVLEGSLVLPWFLHPVASFQEFKSWADGFLSKNVFPLVGR